MHDVAVALDEETVGDFHRADLGDAADIVAAEIEQHQMLGALLGIGEQFGGETLILCGRLAAPAGAGDRADRHFALADAHQDFRARDDDLEAAEIEIAEIRRRIDAPQRPVEREGGQVETAGEALRQHDLEHIAGDDIFLGLDDHRVEFGLARVGLDLARHQASGRSAAAHGRAALRARRRSPSSRACALSKAALAETPFCRANRRDDGDFVANAVEDHHDRRADHHRFGHADRIGLGRRQALHMAHHVVAEIAEYAGRHRRQAGGNVDPRFGEQRAQRVERLAGAGRRKRPGSCSARRLISDWPPVERQTMSGSRPIIE